MTKTKIGNKNKKAPACVAVTPRCVAHAVIIFVFALMNVCLLACLVWGYGHYRAATREIGRLLAERNFEQPAEMAPSDLPAAEILVEFATTSEPLALVAPAPLSLDIRNGGSIVGRAAKLATELGAENSLYTIDKVANAANRNYQGIIVVNLSGKDVSALEEKFGVTAIAAVPEDEEASVADVLIILGN